MEQDNVNTTALPPGRFTALGESVDLESLRIRLQAMSDEELITFGRQMRRLVYPLSYGPKGKPVVCAFSIQLEEARSEWRRRFASGAGGGTHGTLTAVKDHS